MSRYNIILTVTDRSDCPELMLARAAISIAMLEDITLEDECIQCLEDEAVAGLDDE